jgi:hypothetical protein
MDFKIPKYLRDNNQSGPNIKKIRYPFYLNFLYKKSIFFDANI